MVGQKSSRKTLPPKNLQTFTHLKFNRNTPEKSPYLKPEIHVPKHHFWHAFVKYWGGLINRICKPWDMSSLLLSRWTRWTRWKRRCCWPPGQHPHPELSWEKRQVPMNVFQGVFLLYFSCVSGMEEEQNSIMEKTKNTDWDDEIIFWEIFRMSTYTSVDCRCVPWGFLMVVWDDSSPKLCRGSVEFWGVNHLAEDPWDWNIYLHLPLNSTKWNVGRKYTRNMDPMGLDSHKHSAKVGS